MTTAYVYKWTHLPTMMWYVGSRTRKNCHPNDGYICSSKVVEPMVIQNHSEWKREIIAIGTKEQMISLEVEILQLFDAKNDPRSYNSHNGDGKFNGVVNKGVKKTEEHRKKLQAHLDILNKKFRVGKLGTFTGKSHSDDTKHALSDKQIGSNNSKWKGYYVDPMGNFHTTSKKAAGIFKVSHMTIQRWAKNNLNGWSFIHKEKPVSSGLYGLTIKGEHRNV